MSHAPVGVEKKKKNATEKSKGFHCFSITRSKLCHRPPRYALASPLPKILHTFKCLYSFSLSNSPFSNSNWNFLRLNLGLFLWIMRWKFGLMIMMFVESLFCERVKFQCGGPRQRYRHTRRQSSRR